MKKLYIVHWGSSSSDDDGNAKAFCGIHGVYTSKEDAIKGLVECKDLTYDEAVQSDDPEDLEYNKVNTSVYGSVEEEYFEVDYFIGDIPCEVYIKISEQ